MILGFGASQQSRNTFFGGEGGGEPAAAAEGQKKLVIGTNTGKYAYGDLETA